MCAAGTKGFGNYLMDMAYKLAYKLGCSTVALAALPDAAGFYYGKHGFRFANRDGDLVNIEDTPWHKETEEGVRLVPSALFTPTPAFACAHWLPWHGLLRASTL